MAARCLSNRFEFHSHGESGKTETLTCTPEHPLYVTGQGWVEAGDLVSGPASSCLSPREGFLHIARS
jgi:hypothetical protein